MTTDGNLFPSISLVHYLVVNVVGNVKASGLILSLPLFSPARLEDYAVGTSPPEVLGGLAAVLGKIPRTSSSMLDTESNISLVSQKVGTTKSITECPISVGMKFRCRHPITLARALLEARLVHAPDPAIDAPATALRMAHAPSQCTIETPQNHQTRDSQWMPPTLGVLHPGIVRSRSISSSLLVDLIESALPEPSWPSFLSRLLRLT